MANDAPDTGTTKSRNAKYTYRQPDGTIAEKFDENARSVIVTVIGADKSVEISTAALMGDEAAANAFHEANPIAGMCLLFGGKTTVGNALAPASKLGWSAADMVTALSDRVETLTVDKEWREGGGGGPRTGHIVDAVAAIFLADSGKELNAAGREALKATIKEKGSKPFTDDPRIAAEIAAATMRRAQEDLARKQAAAKAATGGASILDSLGLSA